MVGIRDTSLSEKLQTDATLEKAKTAIRQKAAVRDLRRKLQQQTEKALDQIHGGKLQPKRSSGKPQHIRGAPEIRQTVHKVRL